MGEEIGPFEGEGKAAWLARDHLQSQVSVPVPQSCGVTSSSRANLQGLGWPGGVLHMITCPSPAQGHLLCNIQNKICTLINRGSANVDVAWPGSCLII